MPPKRKIIISLIENIGLIAFGITNTVAGTGFWSFEPILAISLYILSLICVVRGVSELAEAFSMRDKGN